MDENKRLLSALPDDSDIPTSCWGRFWRALIDFFRPATQCPWSLAGYLRLGFILLLLSLLILAGIFAPQLKTLVGANGPIQTFLQSIGWWGPVIYAAIYAVSAPLMIPGSILSPVAGIIFTEIWVALLVVLVGATTGCCIAFFLGRTVLRNWVVRKMEEYPTFSAVDAAIANKGLLMVILLRLSPVFPFVILNYALSITSISALSYCFGSAVGMIPGIVLYVYMPWAIVHSVSSEGTNNVLTWVLLVGVGGVVTIAIVVIVTLLAKRAIDEEMEKQKKEAESKAQVDKNEAAVQKSD